jgi:hypothetical protein
MDTLGIGSLVKDPKVHVDAGEPFLEVEGIEGSTLRATLSGLVVCTSRSSSPTHGDRSWAYEQLGALRLDAHDSMAVIRATIRTTGRELPLLLLEPTQVTAARRSLEVIWNLMGSLSESRLTA